MVRRRTGLTLVELIIAMALVSVLVLAVTSFDFFCRSQVVSSQRRAQLQNEATGALEHMNRYIAQAIGDINNQPFSGYSDNRGIRIRVDSNGNGQLDASDRYIAYRHINDEISFYSNATLSDPPSGSSEVISRKITITNNPFAAESSTNPWGLKIDIVSVNQLEVKVRARWYPNPAVSLSLDNPEVTLKTNIICNSVSVN